MANLQVAKGAAGRFRDLLPIHRLHILDLPIPFSAHPEPKQAPMRTTGFICLILGVIAVIRAINMELPQHGSEAYKRGAAIGRTMAPVVLLGAGLWLLLREGGTGQRRTPARPVRPAGLPGRPLIPPPLPPGQIPVKIQCTCGQNYAFDVEPVEGRMPTRINCPACGADGTDTANAFIAGVLVTRAQTPAPPPPMVTGRSQKLHPILIVGMVIVGLLMVAVVGSRVIGRFSSPRNRPVPISRPDSRRMPPPGPQEGISGRSSRPGSVREAAPVPPNATSVEVFWGNRWWPATILRRDGQRAFIHYDGWNSSYDEWVTPDRLRPRK